MRDINYGFPALEHRYRVLGGRNYCRIHNSQLFDLASKLIETHGPRYVGQPRLEKIVDLNGVSRQHFLTGREEAKAFENKEYVKLHQSTLKKVDVIHNLAEREWGGRLRTKAGWRDRYGSTVGGIVEVVTDHWLYKVLGFIGIVASIAGVASLLR